MGTEKTGGRCRPHAGLSPQLSRAIALPCEEGGDGEIVGMDDGPVAAWLAWREPPRWRADVLLGMPGRVQRTGHTLPVGGLQVVGVVQEWLRLRAQGVDGLAESQELSCSLAHQGHEDTARPPARAATTTHDLWPLLAERVGLAP
jgi:hypothetical protein